MLRKFVLMLLLSSPLYAEMNKEEFYRDAHVQTFVKSRISEIRNERAQKQAYENYFWGWIKAPQTQVPSKYALMSKREEGEIQKLLRKASLLMTQQLWRQNPEVSWIHLTARLESEWNDVKNAPSFHDLLGEKGLPRDNINGTAAFFFARKQIAQRTHSERAHLTAETLADFTASTLRICPVGAAPTHKWNPTEHFVHEPSPYIFYDETAWLPPQEGITNTRQQPSQWVQPAVVAAMVLYGGVKLYEYIAPRREKIRAANSFFDATRSLGIIPQNLP